MSSSKDSKDLVRDRKQFLEDTIDYISSAQPLSPDDIRVIRDRFQALQLGPQRIVWKSLLEEKLQLHNHVTVLMALAETLEWVQPYTAAIVMVFYSEHRRNDDSVSNTLVALREMELKP